MTSGKRNYIALTLLLLISIPVVLFIYYKVQQVIVRHEMMKKLEYAQLQTIELAASDVRWYEKDREIIVKGKLFDVVSQTKVPGTDKILFAGLFDEAETELEFKAGRLLREQEKNDASDKLVETIWLFNSPIQNSDQLSAMFTEVSTSYYPLIPSRMPLVDIAIPAPPPKA
jgi:hypothetical protein